MMVGDGYRKFLRMLVSKAALCRSTPDLKLLLMEQKDGLNCA